MRFENSFMITQRRQEWPSGVYLKTMRGLLPSFRNKHSRGCDLSQRGDLTVVFDELDEHVRKFRQVELQRFVWNQFLIGGTRRHDEKSTTWPEYDLQFGPGRSLVISGNALGGGFVEFRRATHKANFALIQRHCRFVDIALRICGEVHRPFAVLFVVWSIETIVMKVSQRQNDLVKIKLQRVVLHRDLQTAVSRMFVLAGIIPERMRRLRVGNAAKALFGSRLGARFLSFQTDVEEAISPRRQLHSQQTLIDVVAERVVKRRRVVADDENDHADVFIWHE